MRQPSSRRLTWLYSWEEAGHHPRRALLTLFIQGLVGFGLLAYFRLTDESLVGSAIVGIAGGCLLALVGRRYLSDPTRAREGRRGFIFEGVMGAIGVALVVAGIAILDLGLVIAGLAFIALSVALIAVKMVIAR